MTKKEKKEVIKGVLKLIMIAASIKFMFMIDNVLEFVVDTNGKGMIQESVREFTHSSRFEKCLIVNPQTPVAQKVADEVVFRRF